MLTLLGAESVVIGTLAALFALVAWRTREAGMGWLVAGFGLAFGWYATSSAVPLTGPDIDTTALRLSSSLIGAAVLCVTAGTIRYLGLPSRPLARAAVLGCMAPGLAQVGWLLAGGTLSHESFHIGVLAAYLGAAALAFQRGAATPGDGHGMLGVALLALALTPYALAAMGMPADQLKYVAGLLLAMFGMILLTVSLLRGQRQLDRENMRRAAAEAALRDANSGLEARVGERTAHLHELIAGLESFNRGVSHDLRGPLGGMSTLARQALDALARDDTALAQRALPLIAGQCEASMQMVDTMLDLARIGAVPVRREPVDLGALVRSAFDETLLGATAGPRPQLVCDALPTVLADAGLLRRVFVNLFGNAVKFARESAQPQVRVGAVASGRDLRIDVQDNGVGFEPGQAEQLFEPFYRAHAARFEGHGLGLSIVRRAVGAMGGRVEARGEPGVGATISFTLPGALAPTPALARQSLAA